ncbi:MAG: hypothetical protein IT327_03250 [Anaerolineae bacterium]|nr:hypothetical protein [Anaerolineae bacterium]
MKHFSKNALLFGGMLLLVMLGACRYPGTGTDPARIVAKTAEKIAVFTLPPGYEPEYGLHALGYTAVAYHDDEAGHLYLVQSESEADGTALQEALDEMVPGYQDEERELEVVEQWSFTLRGQEVLVTISEGMGWEDEMMRQATAVFRGKAGPTLLILREPSNRWDEAAVQAFLTSIQ